MTMSAATTDQTTVSLPKGPRFEVGDLVSYASIFQDVGRVMEIKLGRGADGTPVYEYLIQWVTVCDLLTGVGDPADPEDISHELETTLRLASDDIMD